MEVLVYAAYDEGTGTLSGLIGEGSKTGTSTKSIVSGSSDTGSTALVAGTTYYLQAVIENSANSATLTSRVLAFQRDGSMENPNINFMTEATGTGVSALSSKDGTFCA